MSDPLSHPTLARQTQVAVYDDFVVKAVAFGKRKVLCIIKVLPIKRVETSTIRLVYRMSLFLCASLRFTALFDMPRHDIMYAAARNDRQAEWV
jgi:hypothetical protein